MSSDAHTRNENSTQVWRRILLLAPPGPCGLTVLELAIQGALPQFDAALAIGAGEPEWRLAARNRAAHAGIVYRDFVAVRVPAPGSEAELTGVILRALPQQYEVPSAALNRIELAIPVPAERVGQCQWPSRIRTAFPLATLGWTTADCLAFLATRRP